MNAVKHVVAQTIGPERATVTDAMFENIPCVGKLCLVFPDDAEHFTIVTRFGLTDQPERNESGKPAIVGSQFIHTVFSIQSFHSRSSLSTAKNCPGSLFESAVLYKAYRW